MRFLSWILSEYPRNVFSGRLEIANCKTLASGLTLGASSIDKNNAQAPWNKLEPHGTSWNHLERGWTNKTELERDGTSKNYG